MNERILLAALYVLGAAFILCLGGIIALAWVGDRPIPDVLVATTSGILGAFVGILVPSVRR